MFTVIEVICHFIKCSILLWNEFCQHLFCNFTIIH